jgi:hypothetical protein
MFIIITPLICLEPSEKSGGYFFIEETKCGTTTGIGSYINIVKQDNKKKKR